MGRLKAILGINTVLFDTNTDRFYHGSMIKLENQVLDTR